MFDNSATFRFSLQSQPSRPPTAPDCTESSLTRLSATSSGTAGTERPQDTSARPVSPTTVKLASACGPIKCQNAKTKVRLEFIWREHKSHRLLKIFVEVANGFACPAAGEIANAGSFSRHAHPEDCRKYYICLEGVAREYGCPIGTVFKIGDSDGSGNCEDPEDVPGW